MSDTVEREAFLFIGLNLANITPDNYAEFNSSDLIPIAWYLLFDKKDIRTRQEVMPESIALFAGEFDHNANYEQDFQSFLNEPVAFETTIPKAQERLYRFKEIFRDLPYFWSYFRVIEIFEEQLIFQIDKIAEKTDEAIPLMQTKHPDVVKSSVKTKEKEKEGDPMDISIDDLTAFANLDFGDFGTNVQSSPKKKEEKSLDVDDNPFAAALSDFGATAQPKKSSKAEVNQSTGFDDSFLLDSLGAALELDKDAKTDEPEIIEESEEDIDEAQSLMFITAKFDHLAIEGYGERIHTIFERLESLYHHARREEGKITRIMVDILQDIFRESMTKWRITGLLSEDFVQGDPSRLGSIMIGNPSAFNIKSKQTFDLEFWTEKTLQLGDERLMFTLSKLPSEDLHEMITEGNISQVSSIIEKTLLLTKSKIIPDYSMKSLSLEPAESNIWGIRVLLPYGESFTPGTLLCRDPNITWKDDFDKRLDLPGVLNDWNIEYLVRFSDFSHSEKYQIVFKRAGSKEATYKGFVRWVRRHNLLYRKKFGIDGTIELLKKTIIETQDQISGQIIFTILTNLSQLGFHKAIDVLNDQTVVSRLSWLYSTI